MKGAAAQESLEDISQREPNDWRNYVEQFDDY